MYESFYQYSAKPFQVSPDPRFFFASKGHKRAMSYLRYGLSQGEGFVVITGGVGTGKTTLIRSLFSDLDAADLLAAQLVSSNLQADDLLQMISAAFDLPREGRSKGELLNQFEAFLRQADREGKRVLLVVDEAQNLPASTVEELRMLSNFQVENRPLLQSFLLGQEEFRGLVQSPQMEQLRQRIIASCHLQPLDQVETRGYIEHRLQRVGWAGTNPAISDDAFDAIHAISQGVPRRINTFCDRLLLYGFLEELECLDADAVDVVRREVLAEQPSAPRAAASIAAADDAWDEGEEDQQVPTLTVPRHQRAPVTELEKRVADLEYVIEALEKNFERKVSLLKSVVQSLKSGL
ncbi:MAG: XrtA/PEP-CTERM system-associated ATPase [Pseudomonadota bacterium]|nr:XrtA/PEP-CTERM system-associated ATPase [Pseudomonadota bacterium]